MSNLFLTTLRSQYEHARVCRLSSAPTAVSMASVLVSSQWTPAVYASLHDLCSCSFITVTFLLSTQAIRVAHQIRAGTVYVNCYSTFASCLLFGDSFLSCDHRRFRRCCAIWRYDVCLLLHINLVTHCFFEHHRLQGLMLQYYTSAHALTGTLTEFRHWSRAR